MLWAVLLQLHCARAFIDEADDLSCVQAVMDHSHAMSGNAFTVSREEYSRSPGGLSYHFGSKPRKKGPMRPSMELRHRQLDLSLLQVGPPACFLHC